MKSGARVQKSVWLLNILRLITDKPTCLMVKHIQGAILFENKKHEVYTVNKHKIALNRDDGKGFVQADGVTTIAREHVAPSA